MSVKFPWTTWADDDRSRKNYNIKATLNKTGNVRITQHRGAFVQVLLQWKINNYYIFRGFVCILRCLACKAPAPCCHVLPVRFNNIFSSLSHKRPDSRYKVIEHGKCVSIFSTNFFWNISRSKKNWARYDQECVLVFA